VEDLLAFVLAGFALTGSPGPATLSLAAIGGAFGLRPGLGYLFGLVLGLLVIMAVTSSGLAGLVLVLPGVAPLVTAAAVAYILYLAYRIATAPPAAEAGATARAPSAGTGFVLALVNPKAYAAMAALFSGFVLVAGQLLVDALVKMAILTVIIVAVDLAWLCLGGLLRRRVRDPALHRAINLGFAVLLVASVAFAFFL